jgi:hypothetical protein
MNSGATAPEWGGLSVVVAHGTDASQAVTGEAGWEDILTVSITASAAHGFILVFGSCRNECGAGVPSNMRVGLGSSYGDSVYVGELSAGNAMYGFSNASASAQSAKLSFNAGADGNATTCSLMAIAVC